MKLSVIIVSYNVKHYLWQCLDSLMNAIRDVDAEVYVVDNHSHDDSVEFLRKSFPQVHYIASNHNLGFAKANNLAIRHSTGEYVLLLNPDTVVGGDVIQDCLSFMDEHIDTGSVGVRMLKADGNDAMESRRGLPTPMTSFYKMTGLYSHFPKSRKFGKYYMSYLPWDSPQQIEVVSGAFCMLRRAAIDKVGLLDEDFFMYGEDIDLSYRILKGGYQNWYLPSLILHYKGESTQKSSFRYVHVFYDAMLIFLRKHYGHISFWFSIPIKTAIYLKAAIALFGMLSSRMRKSLGFFTKERNYDVSYVFIGKERSIEQCRAIAKDKGLAAKFFIADAGKAPRGHHDMGVKGGSQPVCVVYDTESYTYRHILDIFSHNPQNNVFIGIYNPESQTIITCDEVIVGK